MGSESREGEITGRGEQGAAGLRGSLCRPHGRPTTPHTLRSGALLGPIACGRAAVDLQRSAGSWWRGWPGLSRSPLVESARALLSLAEASDCTASSGPRKPGGHGAAPSGRVRGALGGRGSLAVPDLLRPVRWAEGAAGGRPLSHPEAVEEAALGLSPLLGPRALPATSLTDHRFKLRSQSVQPLTQVSPAGRCVEVQGPIWAAGAPLGRDCSAALPGGQASAARLSAGGDGQRGWGLVTSEEAVVACGWYARPVSPPLLAPRGEGCLLDG